MEIEENLNVAAFTGLETSVVARNKPIYLACKRMTDFVLALIGLIILSPVFLVVAFLIKWDDPKGTVFFSQDRVGKDGELFKMYKFRSMYVDAEERLAQLLKYNEVSGAMFKMKEDPRVTKIGACIRKCSIDELPQLFNVLMGNMSLVGPRPALIREVEAYTSHDKQRLLVTPGISGLWQVSGRSRLTFAQMVDLDLEYVVTRSYWMDIKILFKTVKVVCKGDGAY
ncbi:lipopolysaccharide/colanic/teichoic acid biosynthesis glycosyltransferase [Trichococcus patagoniensis]|uniref:Lipopolysaccharide/colanic/teichoic acid biosynthesis glycosyltransferase n=1 Tax=Trichococcus patagoniensis TaxID=382641 RepID=A0A2T5IQ67_9LACT|nr:sugar transferase [Trichococcus patagoniensis]PTQ85930.1 lipopolysaccharide/colanic/teichoic acid biosynthesis glycosyltransferase [Trichococcus patagoniensis]